MKILRIGLSLLLGTLLLIFAAKPALAFCGFYVAKADSSLYNQASQVIIARDGNKTVLTMSNDYQGEVKDFAMVVPVPVVLTEEQVHIADPEIIERLDTVSAPRLVEYFDEDPCSQETPKIKPYRGLMGLYNGIFGESPEAKTRTALGVTVEKQFIVGEYDIVILSAKESDGLEKWLIQNNYQIPQGTKELLQPYIRQKMKFFVAKVNLDEFDNSRFEHLRPISILYESPKFTLPIRLGMLNANGDQDLIVYFLSPQGQVELTNYRTAKLPSNVQIPEFIEQNFQNFYTAMFQNLYEAKSKQVAFLEYAWNLSTKCDPCTAQPLNQKELKQAGVFWLDSTDDINSQRRHKVFITRLHIRYNRENFPEDLKFQTTGNKSNFQERYIIYHPFEGIISCEAGKKYLRDLDWRHKYEASNLSELTGWNLKEIYDRINSSGTEVSLVN